MVDLGMILMGLLYITYTQNRSIRKAAPASLPRITRMNANLNANRRVPKSL